MTMVWAVIRVALLIAVSAIAIATVVLPAATGAQVYTVMTGSMTPSYPPGTLVVVRGGEPAIGDVITFQRESGVAATVTHRVVGMTFTAAGVQYETRGDANNASDPDAVRPEQVRGVLWYSVPYVGWAGALVGPLRPWLLPAVAAGLFGYGGVMFALAWRDRRRRSPETTDLPLEARGRHAT